MAQTLAIYFPGGWEWIVILIIALLIFGKKLPDVGKSLGKGIVEFKKGLQGMKDEMDNVNDEVDEAVSRDTNAEKESDSPQQIESDEATRDRTAEEAGAAQAARQEEKNRAET